MIAVPAIQVPTGSRRARGATRQGLVWPGTVFTVRGFAPDGRAAVAFVCESDLDDEGDGSRPVVGGEATGPGVMQDRGAAHESQGSAMG